MFKKCRVSHRTNQLICYWGLKKYQFKSIGNNVRICMPGYFSRTEYIIIEDNVFIGRDFHIDAQSDIVIGAGTMIGPKCTCIAGSHCYDAPDLRSIPYDNRMKTLPITIGKNVWIAANVNISPGTNIGEGCVIGMGVTVYGDIPPYTVIVNNGYRILKTRDKNNYNKLKEKEAIYNVLYAGKGFEYIDE